MSALGVLFDCGTFTQLRRLEIRVGAYHSGEARQEHSFRSCLITRLLDNGIDDWDRPWRFLQLAAWACSQHHSGQEEEKLAIA